MITWLGINNTPFRHMCHALRAAVGGIGIDTPERPNFVTDSDFQVS